MHLCNDCKYVSQPEPHWTPWPCLGSAGPVWHRTHKKSCKMGPSNIKGTSWTAAAVLPAPLNIASGLCCLEQSTPQHSTVLLSAPAWRGGHRPLQPRYAQPPATLPAARAVECCTDTCTLCRLPQMPLCPGMPINGPNGPLLRTAGAVSSSHTKHPVTPTPLCHSRSLSIP